MRSGTVITCTLGILLNRFLVVAPFPANKLNKAAVGVLENCTTTVTLLDGIVIAEVFRDLSGESTSRDGECQS